MVFVVDSTIRKYIYWQTRGKMICYVGALNALTTLRNVLCLGPVESNWGGIRHRQYAHSNARALAHICTGFWKLRSTRRPRACVYHPQGVCCACGRACYAARRFRTLVSMCINACVWHCCVANWRLCYRCARCSKASYINSLLSCADGRTRDTYICIYCTLL